MGKRFFFVTNSSNKSRKDFAMKFTKIGYPCNPEDIVCSAYVTAQVLKNKFKYTGKVYCLCSSDMATEFVEVGITPVGIGPDTTRLRDLDGFPMDPEVKCVVVGFDEHFSYTKAAKASMYLQTKGTLFIGTNGDTGTPTASGKLMPAEGAMLNMVASASGRIPDAVCGKPSQHMFDVVMDQYLVNPKRTIVIGDRLDTDIQMANNCGLKSLLVLTGLSTLADVKKRQASKNVEDWKQIPTFWANSLAEIGPLLDKINK